MHEVLDNLFDDIAEAIRSRTRTTGDIKPSEFAERINDIRIIGESLSLDLVDGSFDATSEVMTVTHDIGKVPDMLMIYPTRPPEAGYITLVYGFSSAMISTIKNYETTYPSKVIYVIPNGTGCLHFGLNVGFDQNANNESAIERGHIRDVTDTTFVIGSNATSGSPKLKPGGTYGYIAITGFLC